MNAKTIRKFYNAAIKNGELIVRIQKVADIPEAPPKPSPPEEEGWRDCFYRLGWVKVTQHEGYRIREAIGFEEVGEGDRPYFRHYEKEMLADTMFANPTLLETQSSHDPVWEAYHNWQNTILFRKNGPTGSPILDALHAVRSLSKKSSITIEDGTYTLYYPLSKEDRSAKFSRKFAATLHKVFGLAKRSGIQVKIG